MTALGGKRTLADASRRRTWLPRTFHGMASVYLFEEVQSMKPVMTVMLVGSACILVTGCATAPPPSAPRTAQFTCNNGQSLTVVFEGDKATVTPEGGEAIVLPQAPSGSGFLYMTPQHSLRGKGDAVSWTVGRMVPMQCSTAE